MADTDNDKKQKFAAEERERTPREEVLEGLKKDVEEASVASLKDYDPNKVPDSEKVVELADHSSVRVKDLVDHPNSVISNDAKDVVAERHPTGKHFPNGPAKKTSDSK